MIQKTVYQKNLLHLFMLSCKAIVILPEHVNRQVVSSDAIEIIKKYTKIFYWHKKGLLMWFTVTYINEVKATQRGCLMTSINCVKSNRGTYFFMFIIQTKDFLPKETSSKMFSEFCLLNASSSRSEEFHIKDFEVLVGGKQQLWIK